jgi:2-hydroxychromene-2-carboxylate isomerase
MNDPVTFYFDYVDPLSALMDEQLRHIGASSSVERVPWASSPRGTPSESTGATPWGERLLAAREVWPGDTPNWTPPSFVPRTEKALELYLHASSEGRGDALHRALFRGFFEEGKDLGRIDILVELAGSIGLDRTTAKVTLDVDRYSEPLQELREVGERQGIAGVPTLVSPRGILNGRVTVQELRDFVNI